MNKKLSKRRKRGRSQSCWSGELPLITSKSEYFIALSLFYLTSDSYGNPIVYPESDSLRSWQYTLDFIFFLCSLLRNGEECARKGLMSFWFYLLSSFFSGFLLESCTGIAEVRVPITASHKLRLQLWGFSFLQLHPEPNWSSCALARWIVACRVTIFTLPNLPPS